MASIIIIFVLVTGIAAIVSMSISKFTNRTINNLMNQLPDLEGQDKPKRFYHAADFTNESQPKASDKDVIDVAVANNGKVTPTVLCARLDISVDEATAKLENTESGHLVYVLVDLDLMR